MPKPQFDRAFETYGVGFTGEAGDERFGACPFCGATKFYANMETGQWSCKAGGCGRSGNLYSFLSQIWQHHLDNTTLADYKVLSEERTLKVATLRKHKLAWTGSEWLLPYYNEKKALVQLRHCTPGKPLFNTPGIKAALYGRERFADRIPKLTPVWICEGEWDAMALYEILKRAGRADVVLATPGASIWKTTWNEMFAERFVTIAYDADTAGRSGTDRLVAHLQGARAEVSVVEWPEEVPDGFDVRDFRKLGGRYVDLVGLVKRQSYLRPGQKEKPALGDQDEKVSPAVETAGAKLNEAFTFDQALEVYRKWLHMNGETENALRIIYATALSNRIAGDPLWLFLVAPPGGCKTELLLSVSTCEDVVVRSTLTPHSLVSGFRMPDGQDPSLIPHLNGRLFVLKDFTEVLQMPRTERDEVYSILRGAYDGSVEKSFGNGLQRSYKCHFSMVAGVTYAIQADRTASLGERFLLYKVKELGGAPAILAAMRNSGKETGMREDLAGAGCAYLSQEIDPENLPRFTDETLNQVVALAQLVALLRGEVAKDFRGEMVLYKPQTEIGTRLAKQLHKLGVCLQLLEGGRTVSEKTYRLLERVSLDTCDGFALEVFLYIGHSKAGLVNLQKLCEETGIPRTTLREKLEDMVLLGVLEKEFEKTGGRGAPNVNYKLTARLAELWKILPNIIPPPQDRAGILRGE